MVITQGQLVEVLNNYIDTDIMPNINKLSSLEQLLAGIKIGVIKRSIPKMVNDYLDKPELKLLGVVTDKGINLDVIYESAKESIKKLGTVEYGNFRFNETDVDKIYTLAKDLGGEPIAQIV